MIQNEGTRDDILVALAENTDGLVSGIGPFQASFTAAFSLWARPSATSLALFDTRQFLRAAERGSPEQEPISTAPRLHLEKQAIPIPISSRLCQALQPRCSEFSHDVPLSQPHIQPHILCGAEWNSVISHEIAIVLIIGRL